MIFNKKLNSEVALDCPEAKNELQAWKKVHSSEIRAVTVTSEAEKLIAKFVNDFESCELSYPYLQSLEPHKQLHYVQRLFATLRNRIKANKKENHGMFIISHQKQLF